MTSDTTADSRPQWESRLAAILALRDNSDSTAPQWRRTRAELRRGASAHTESYAYPHVLPYTDPHMSTRTKTTLIRLFAAAAEFEAIPQFRRTPELNRRTFGQWCYLVSAALARSRNDTYTADPDEPDAIGQRLQFLHTLDTEQALLTVTRIMKLASSLPGPVPALDYFDLFRMFLRWGNGLSPESQHVRRRILRDYYSAYASPAPTTSPQS